MTDTTMTSPISARSVETNSKCNQALRLTEQLCFAVYSTGHAFNGAYKRLLKSLNLTYPQFNVMFTLWYRDGRTVKDIGEALHLDSGTLTPMLKRLETAGLVKRSRDAVDERLVRIHLTAAGVAMHEKAKDVPAELAKLICASGQTKQDVCELRDNLLRVRDSLNAAEAEQCNEDDRGHQK